VPSARATSFRAWKPDQPRWTPPTADEWCAILRSVSIGRDLLFWKRSEFVASGIATDLAAVTQLSDALDDALGELEQATAVVLEAQRRLLVVAMETTPAA
jgi:hypothetical protein